MKFYSGLKNGFTGLLRRTELRTKSVLHDRSKNQNLNVKKLHISEPTGISLSFFESTSPTRQFVYTIITRKWYMILIQSLGVLSSLLLIFYSPLKDPKEDTLNKSIIMIEYIFSYFFFIESLVEIFAFGAFFNGPNSYLRQNLNMLDFLFNLLIITNHWLGSKTGVYFNASRALRTFTLVELLNSTASINIIVHSLMNSIPSIFNLVLIETILFFAISIVCVSYFKGSFFECDKANIPSKIG